MANTQVLTRPVRKHPSPKKFEALSTCPVGGAGWCAFPFTVTELDKKVKHKATKTKKKLQTNLQNPSRDWLVN